MKSIMTIEMVADYLNLSEDEVLKLARKRKIPCAKIGGKFLFVKSLVDDWLVNEALKYESGNGE